MIDHGVAQFRLSTPQADGATLRQHLEVVQRTTGETPEELIVPELPHCGMSLWGAYLELHHARSGNGFGMNPIGHAGLLAWQQVHGIALNSFEAETLLALDAAVMAQVNSRKTS